MDISIIINRSIDSILLSIAERVKARRLEQNLTQREFSKRAGVGYDTYRRFETSGEISLRNLVLCSIVLDSSDEFAKLFSVQSYQSLDELLTNKQVKKKKRASRNG